MDTELLTVQEVADLLRVDGQTVRRFISRGELSAARIGHQWRVPREVVEQFIARRMAEA